MSRMGENMDEISLTGMEFFGVHGCLPAEREFSQPFVVDVSLKLPLEIAGKNDDMNDTVDYANVADIVSKIIEGEPKNLIEALANEIADNILSEFEKVREVSVCVHKPRAPIGKVVRDVSVKMVRKR